MSLSSNIPAHMKLCRRHKVLAFSSHSQEGASSVETAEVVS